MSLPKMSDTFYALRFLRLLTMPWEKTAAFKTGIIDENGKRIKDPRTPEEKSAYTVFHKIVFNVRRVFSRLPSTLAKRLSTYATALFLIREHYDLGPKFEQVVESRIHLLSKDGMLEPMLECVFDKSVIYGECLNMTITKSMVEGMAVGDNTTTSVAPDFNKRVVAVSNKTFRRMRIGRNKNWKKRIKDEDEYSKIVKAYESCDGGIIVQCEDTGAMIAIKNVLV